jgi:hypothetical protein
VCLHQKDQSASAVEGNYGFLDVELYEVDNSADNMQSF